MNLSVPSKLLGMFSSNKELSHLKKKDEEAIQNVYTLVQTTVNSSRLETVEESYSATYAETEYSAENVPSAVQNSEHSSRLFKAIFGYRKRRDDELSFEEGHVFSIIDRSSLRYLARSMFSFEKGYIPVQYIGSSEIGGMERGNNGNSMLPNRTADDLLDSCSWFYRNISREESGKMLLQPANVPGTFIVRECGSHPGYFSLSLLVGQLVSLVHHYDIRRNDRNGREYYITEEKRFPSLMQLVEFYSTESYNLHHKLTTPCPPCHESERETNHGMGRPYTEPQNISSSSNSDFPKGYYDIPAANHNWSPLQKGDIGCEKGSQFIIRRKKSSDIETDHHLQGLYPQPWFFGNISRVLSEELLKRPGLQRGTFLVRIGQSDPGTFVVSLTNGEPRREVEHYRIRRLEDKNQYTMGNITAFESVKKLVQFYSHNVFNRDRKLTGPCPPLRPVMDVVHATKLRINSETTVQTKISQHWNLHNDHECCEGAADTAVAEKLQPQKFDYSGDNGSTCFSQQVSQHSGLIPVNVIPDQEYEEMYMADNATTECFSSQPWFFGNIGRIYADELLKRPGVKPGMFLVRTSGSETALFSLSVNAAKTVDHYRIRRMQNRYSLTGGYSFESIAKLIKFYSGKNATHLALTEPCPKDEQTEHHIVSSE